MFPATRSASGRATFESRELRVAGDNFIGGCAQCGVGSRRVAVLDRRQLSFRLNSLLMGGVQVGAHLLQLGVEGIPAVAAAQWLLPETWRCRPAPGARIELRLQARPLLAQGLQALIAAVELFVLCLLDVGIGHSIHDLGQPVRDARPAG